MNPTAPLALLALLALPAGAVAAPRRAALSAQEELGKKLFLDEQLSANRNQSCAACHDPAFGTTGAVSAINATGSVYEGSIPGRFGNRRPPSAAYAGDSPRLHQGAEKEWVGGMFWDGRATGATLGDPLAEQAQGPFLNPLEHALPDAAELVRRVCAASYGPAFRAAWGKGACKGDVQADYARIGRSIAAYERSVELSPFSSKYDAVLAGKARLTPQEASGLALFGGQGKCANCHPAARGPRGEPPLFTDFTYDNLGVPRNPLNPFYYQAEANPAGAAWVDEGLGGALRERGEPAAVHEPELGKFKVPTLRNADLRTRPAKAKVGEPSKAFGHNGYFKSLREVVHFYNTRDSLPTCPPGAKGEKVTCWPAPEVARNVNKEEMGNLGLTPAQEEDIVAFLRTLNDGWRP